MVTLPLIGALIHTVFGVLMFVAALFLILLVLVQRGRGGGLSGALGGMGGQSAFGTRAGDTFTYVTIWASAIWILLCIASLKFLGLQPGKLGAQPTTTNTVGPLAPDGTTGQPLDGEAGQPETTVPDGSGAEPSGSGDGDTPEPAAGDGGAPDEGAAAPDPGE